MSEKTNCKYCENEDYKCNVCQNNRICYGSMKDGKCRSRYYAFVSDLYCKRCGKKLDVVNEDHH